MAPVIGRPGRAADALLFAVTAAELAVLVHLTPAFTLVDWVYLSQHLLVLAIALVRRPPHAWDHSLSASAAVAVAYVYPWAQAAYLLWVPGTPLWPEGGLVLVTVAAVLSLSSLASLGRSFGVRPAMRSLVARGPYRVVRHPLYLAYLVSDLGYNAQEFNLGTIVLTLTGWLSLVYRIQIEERVLAQHREWPNYIRSVRYRLVPGIW